MTVDANGNIFTQQTFSGSLYKVSPSAGGYTQSFVANFPLTSAESWVTEAGISSFPAQGNAVWKLDLANPPSLTFTTTAIGSTSSDRPQTVTMFNAGNADLSFVVPAGGANPAITAGFTTGGASTCPRLVSGLGSPCLRPTRRAWMWSALCRSSRGVMPGSW